MKGPEAATALKMRGTPNMFQVLAPVEVAEKLTVAAPVTSATIICSVVADAMQDLRKVPVFTAIVLAPVFCEKKPTTMSVLVEEMEKIAVAAEPAVVLMAVPVAPDAFTFL